MDASIQSALESAQWVAVWVSMLLTALSVVIGAMDPDWRKKRLLRDIQILNGTKEYADPYTLSILRERIENELDSVCKPRLLSASSCVCYAIYYILIICSSIWAWRSSAYTLLVVNIAGIVVVTVCIIVGSIRLSRAWKASKERADERASELSARAKPAIRVIKGALQRGITEEEIVQTLLPEDRAARLYADMLAHDPVMKRYAEQAFLKAAHDLFIEDVNDAAQKGLSSQKDDQAAADVLGDDVDAELLEIFAAVPRACSDLKEQEKEFFAEMDGYMAKLIPCIQDMRDAVCCRSYDSYQARCFQEYFALVLAVKDCLLRFDPYVEAHLKQLFMNVLKKMQRDSGFWAEQAELLSEGGDGVDAERAESLCDELLLDVATARVAQSRYVS